jgi:hypothetical protein
VSRAGWLRWLLLGGWVLVYPDRQLPNTPWVQVSAHDTAEHCEAAKRAMLQGLVHAIVHGPDDSSNDDRVGIRCVPAEHLYPPVKP